MLKLINRAFVVLIILIALLGIVGGVVISLSGFLNFDIESKAFSSFKPHSKLSISGIPTSIAAKDSPYLLNLSVKTPTLEKGDLLYIETYSNEKRIQRTDCLKGSYSAGKYIGKKQINCVINLPYLYEKNDDYNFYILLYNDNGKFYAGPYSMTADWRNYEDFFWRAFSFMFLLVGGVYLIIVLPLSLFVLYQGMTAKHPDAREKEYSLMSLLNPFVSGGTPLQKFNAFLISPYFWVLELVGIFLVLTYMFISTESWTSGTAIVSFFISGLMAFIAPFLWCSIFWLAEFKEREPLRMLVTFFLWGCLAALMAIGMNSALGIVFEIVGLGFLTAFLIAPPVEELYKGTGLALLAEHHEYDSVEDGLVFGFVIGMGFSFVEDWLYMLRNPMGSDIVGWFTVFFMRSVMFSANHGLFTAITGGLLVY